MTVTPTPPRPAAALTPTALSRLAQPRTLLALALGAVLLQACGGGSVVGSAGTGTGTGTGTNAANTSSNSNMEASVTAVSGTVTGFGSVMVDGTEIEDATARIARVNPDGSLSNDVLQLGQRVRLSHDGHGRASQVLIDAALIGQVAAAPDTTARTLTVAGQPVAYSDLASSTAVPLTVFGGGYTGIASLAVGDTVEIHGSPVFDSATQRYLVQATRIQKVPGASRVQVRGALSGYATTATGARFTLNGLTVLTTAATQMHPAAATLADGGTVTVYGTALSGNTLTATHVRVGSGAASTPATAASFAQISGLVSGASATGFALQGTAVTLSSTTAVTPAGAVVGNGAWAVVQGSLAADGSLAATRVSVRSADATAGLARVTLIGPITDFVDAAGFVVRGVPVDASAVSFATSCPGVTPANGLNLRVQAQQQAGTAVVRATQIGCQPTTATVRIRPMDGAVSAVDATARTFTLTPSSSSGTSGTTTEDTAAATPQTVQWTDNTTFLDGLTAATLSGQSVRVEGYASGTLLVARVVRLADSRDSGSGRGSDGLDDHGFHGSGKAKGWGDYRRHP